MLFDSFVGDEEECCAGCRTNDCRSDAAIYAAETTRGPKAGGGLKTGLESVEREERNVDRCACYSACLDVKVSFDRVDLEMNHTKSDRKYGDSTRAPGLSTSIPVSAKASPDIHCHTVFHRDWIGRCVVHIGRQLYYIAQ